MANKTYAPFDAPAVESYDDSAPSKLFDVTCTIGSVYAGPNVGNLSPREAAFVMIAGHSDGREGTYRFPNEHGGETVITVEHVEP